MTVRLHTTNQSGMAYVAILFLLVILLTLGLAFALKTSTETTAMLMRGENMEAQYLAEAAANHALWRLLNESNWAPDADTYYMHSLGSGRYGYKVRLHTATTFATVATIGAVGNNVTNQSYVVFVKPETNIVLEKLYWSEKKSGKIQRSNLDGSDLEDLVTGLGDVKVLELDLGSSKMYWSDKDSGKIQRANLDGSNVEDLLTGLGDITVMELDLSNGKIYWGDKTSGKIQRSNLDGSDLEDLVTGLGDVKAMKLDIVDGKIYWADKTSGKIQRASLDAPKVEDLVTGLGDIKAMALDLGSNKIYWSDKISGKIQRSNLDGSKIEDLATGLGDVTVMKLDVSGGKIYWGDKTSGKIQRASLDGSNVEDLLTGLGDIKVMALDRANNKIYWNDKGTELNQRANLDGSSLETIGTGLRDVKAMKLGPVEAGIRYSALSESATEETATSLTLSIPTGTSRGSLLIAAIATDGNSSGALSPPSLQGWSQISVDSFGGETTLGVWWKLAVGAEADTHTFSWSSGRAAYGWMMRFEGHHLKAPINTSTLTGEASANPTSPSALSTTNDALVLRLGAFDDDDITVGKTGLIGHSSITMAFSSRQWVYWSDKDAGKMQRANLGSFHVEDLTTGLGDVKVMALDLPGGKIYWADKTSSKMQRSDLDGSNVEDIVIKLGDVKVMQLDRDNQKVYWNDKFSGKNQRANLDGSSVEDLTTGLGDVKVMRLDLINNKIYWADKTSTKMQRSDLDGTNLQDLLKGLGDVKVMELDLINNKIYWADKTSAKMQRSDLDGANVQDLVTGLGDVKVMELDLPGGKIYWNDKTTGKMQRADLDGTNVQDLIVGMGDVKVMELDAANGKLYWYDKTEGKIQRSNLDGSNVEDILTTLGDLKVLALADLGTETTGLKFESFAEARASIESNAITIPIPAETSAGDLLIAAVTTDGDNPSLSPPSGEGWTLINLNDYSGAATLGAWWKLATISEPTTHQFNWKVSEQAYGWMMRFTGHDPINPINAFAQTGVLSANPASPSVTTTLGDALILRLGAFDGDNITVDAPGLSGHTAITLDKSGTKNGLVNFESFSEAKLSSSGTSLTITTPVGTSEGDLLIAAVTTDSFESISPPSGEGWTQINQGHTFFLVTMGVWWKLADASESGAHQFTWGSSEQSYGYIMRFTGHNTSNPVNASASDTRTLDSTPPSPSVTTTVANSLILRIGGFDDDDVVIDNTGLSGHTTISMDESNSGSGTCSSGVGYLQQALAGPSGSVNFSLNRGEEARLVTIAIAPAPGGSGVVSGGAGYVKQATAGASGTADFALTASEESQLLSIAIAPAPSSNAVSGGAGFVHQETVGSSGTSTFGLTAIEESQLMTIVIAPEAGG